MALSCRHCQTTAATTEDTFALEFSELDGTLTVYRAAGSTLALEAEADGSTDTANVWRLWKAEGFGQAAVTAGHWIFEEGPRGLPLLNVDR